VRLFPELPAAFRFGAATAAKGLDFYDRLIDELPADGVAPAVTFYHRDPPRA
jgi:beta-glucosidase/6-phospho-beta-glucosidase/beta-galactosidase